MPKNPKALSLFIILILVGLSAAAFFILSRQRAVPPTNQDTALNSPDSTSTDPSNTSNWKTYRNEEHGIEFKYPEDRLYIQELSDSADVYYIYLIQKGRQGKDIDKPGRMIITLNNFADEKYGYAMKNQLCSDVEVLGQKGKICSESVSTKERNVKNYHSFIETGTCDRNINIIFFEPVYSNKNSNGMNTMGVMCDPSDPGITSIFQKMYQTIHFFTKQK